MPSEHLSEEEMYQIEKDEEDLERRRQAGEEEALAAYGQPFTKPKKKRVKK